LPTAGVSVVALEVDTVDLDVVVVVVDFDVVGVGAGAGVVVDLGSSSPGSSAGCAYASDERNRDANRAGTRRLVIRSSYLMVN